MPSRLVDRIRMIHRRRTSARIATQGEDDDEMILLLAFMSSGRAIVHVSKQPVIATRRINILGMESENFRRLFRLEQHDFERLHAALRLPGTIFLNNGSFIDGVDALAIACRRLAYPSRLFDVALIIGGCSESFISRVFKAVIHTFDFCRIASARGLSA